jgi:hypothetical protein
LYEARFDVRHTIAALRSESVSALQPVVKLRRRTEAGEAPR